MNVEIEKITIKIGPDPEPEEAALKVQERRMAHMARTKDGVNAAERRIESEKIRQLKTKNNHFMLKGARI